MEGSACRRHETRTTTCSSHIVDVDSDVAIAAADIAQIIFLSAQYGRRELSQIDLPVQYQSSLVHVSLNCVVYKQVCTRILDFADERRSSNI
jgi:hypothetical protein